MMSKPLRPSARRALNRFSTLAMLTLVPSIVVFGWRGLLMVLAVVVTRSIAERIVRAPRLRVSHWPPLLPVDAFLLCALLPAEIASAERWPLLVCGGVLLALLQRARPVIADVPFDPALVTALALHGMILISGGELRPEASLQRQAAVTGDVLQASESAPTSDPWYKRLRISPEPAQRAVWSADALDDYLHGRIESDGVGESLDGLIRDRLPPLEDLVLIGHPMPLGQASGVFLIGIILWGSYRRTIDWRVPLIAGTAAYVALILLAVPTSVSAEGGHWRFFAAARADVGPATALTFAHYLAFSSPMIIALGVFAGRLETKPLRGGATIVWATTLGVLCAASVLYISVMLGPLIVVALAPAAARVADRWIARRPMRLPI